MQSNVTKECAKLTRKELPQKLITLADLDQGAEETKNPVVQAATEAPKRTPSVHIVMEKDMILPVRV